MTWISGGIRMTKRVLRSFHRPASSLAQQCEDAAQHQSSLRLVTISVALTAMAAAAARPSRLGSTHGPDVAGQEQGLQDGHQIAGGHRVGQDLQPVRHGGDVEQHPRQHHRRQHGGDEGDLGRNELVTRQCRDEQAQAQGEHQEQCRGRGRAPGCRRGTAGRTGRSPSAPTSPCCPCRGRSSSQAWRR